MLLRIVLEEARVWRFAPVLSWGPLMLIGLSVATSCKDHETSVTVHSTCEAHDTCPPLHICVDGTCTTRCDTPAQCAPIQATCRDGSCQAPVCGNDVVEIGEMCDGNCPATCDDGNVCTVDVMSGSATNCSASCAYTDIVSCGVDDGDGGDGCCPPGCTSSTDNDCPDDAFMVTLEAEQGVMVGSMTSQSANLPDPACGGSWVEVPTNAEVPRFTWEPTDPMLPGHRTEFSVTLPHAGTYYVWLRMAAPSGANDALYAGFVATDLRRVYPPNDTYDYDLSWIWVDQVGGDTSRLVFEGLAAGTHTFVLGHGEDGTRCDKIAIADHAGAIFERSCGSATGDICGDAQVTGVEVCDTLGPNLDGETCVTAGYAGGGELACAGDCLSLDVGGCQSGAVDCRGMREYDWTDLEDGTITTSYFSDHHWGLNIHYDPDSISVTSATNRLREAGTKSLRFYIDPVNPPPPASGDDGNLRAEIYEAYEFSTGNTVSWAPDKPLKSEEWISWSYYFPPDFVAGETASTKLLQCHVGAGAAPIDLRYLNPTEYPDSPPDKCPGDECDEFSLTRMWIDDSGAYRETLITDFKPTAGQWMDFVLHVVWDTEAGGDGITEFWINGVPYPGSPGGNTFDNPENRDHPYGAMVKLGMYHGSWRYADSIQASLAEGVDHLEVFMGPVRILSRLQGDYIGADGYVCVAPRGARP